MPGTVGGEKTTANGGVTMVSRWLGVNLIEVTREPIGAWNGGWGEDDGQWRGDSGAWKKW